MTGMHDSNDLALSVTRVIDAPRPLVFKIWTDPKQLTHWWGPCGMTTPFCEMDLRPGGAFRTVMRDESGKEYPTSGVFLEIVKDERIAFTDAFEGGWKPSAKAFMVGVTTFADEGGKTRMTSTALHWSAADRKAHEDMGFHQGWGETADRFVELVMRLKERAS